MLKPPLFPPPVNFSATANITDEYVYQSAAADPTAYWAKWAKELHWFKPWQTVLDWQPPYARWFDGGTLNASANCLDRHLETNAARPNLSNHPAILWEGEPGDQRRLTYLELFEQVNRFAAALQQINIRRGDRVIIYLPMVPELVTACLACARIGAIHSVVFAGLGIDSLIDRINDLEATLVITADYSWRRGKKIFLKNTVDRSLNHCPSVTKTITVCRDPHNPSPACHLSPKRDLLWHKIMSSATANCPPAHQAAEDILFILYTSGTTGKPKGIVHTTGGYLTQVYATAKLVLDLKPDDIYWCTADIGWITGHSYVIYGPLMSGATVFIYEGAFDFPDQARVWQMIERYRISIFYTAPTAIRQFIQWGKNIPAQSDLASLRLLGSVGEPINPSTWRWYHQHIGHARCPIVDTWWQTETGAFMIAPLPGLTSLPPGSATRPFPGISAAVLNSSGQPQPNNQSGLLAITQPWPSMLRGIWRDDKRYRDNYWSKWHNQAYLTGDGAKCDDQQNFWLLGRIDDMIQVAGHRISSTEIENALVSHAAVTEAAVVSKPDRLKGEAVIAFVTLLPSRRPSPALIKSILKLVADRVGPINKPSQIVFTPQLPKTRSGKIMRRLLRNIAASQPLGDTATLADPAVIHALTQIHKTSPSN